MKNRLPLTDKEGEVRELTAEDFAQFKPATEVLPNALLKKLGVSKFDDYKKRTSSRTRIADLLAMSGVEDTELDISPMRDLAQSADIS